MEWGDNNKGGEEYISAVNKILKWYILFCRRKRILVNPIQDIMYPHASESHQGGGTSTRNILSVGEPQITCKSPRLSLEGTSGQS